VGTAGAFFSVGTFVAAGVFLSWGIVFSGEGYVRVADPSVSSAALRG
jgi:hypothetical protein